MKTKILALLLVALSTMSCQSFLEEDIYSQVEGGKIFSNYNEAEMATKNCYSVLHDNLYSWVFQSLTSYGTDESLCRASIASFVRLSEYSLTAGDNHIQSVWKGLYQGIYRCNDTYHKIGKMDKKISEKGKKSLQSEALFLRSFFYFNLVQLWGGVRLNTVEPTFDEVVKKNVSRASVEQVYKQIVEDLEFAKLYLPEIQSQQGRVNRYSAAALLSKVYLTMASGSQYGVAGYECFAPSTYYRLAKENAQIVMTYATESSKVGLMTNYRDIFSTNHKYNKENLFEVSFVIGGAGTRYPDNCGPMTSGPDNPYGYMVSALSGSGLMRPTTYLSLCAYGHTVATTYKNADVTYIRSEDARFIHNIAHWTIGAKYVYTNNIDADIPELMIGVNNPRNWTVAKHAMKTPDQSLFHRWQRPVNFPLIRYADVLLTYAEAAGMLNLNDNSAYAAVNQVRARARVSGTNPDYLKDWSVGDFGSTDQLVDAILDERLRELCFEGQRRFDLLRTGRLFSAIDKMINAVKTYSDPNAPGFDFTALRDLMVTNDVTYPQYESNLKPHHVLFPIPQFEMNIVRSDKYQQNPGWKTADIEDGAAPEE